MISRVAPTSYEYPHCAVGGAALCSSTLCTVIRKTLFIHRVQKHTASLDTIFIQIYMDTLPGVPGVSKIQNFFLQIKLLSFCAKIAPKRHKLEKIIKIGKKCQKTPVFLDFFEYSSIWGQY